MNVNVFNSKKDSPVQPVCASSERVYGAGTVRVDEDIFTTGLGQWCLQEQVACLLCTVVTLGYRLHQFLLYYTSGSV